MTDWGGREEGRAGLSLGGEREEARTGPTRRNMEEGYNYINTLGLWLKETVKDEGNKELQLAREKGSQQTLENTNTGMQVTFKISVSKSVFG